MMNVSSCRFASTTAPAPTKAPDKTPDKPAEKPVRRSEPLPAFVPDNPEPCRLPAPRPGEKTRTC